MQLLITSAVNPNGVQRRFDESTTIDQLKVRLVLVTGIEPKDMKLEVIVGDQTTRRTLGPEVAELTLKQVLEDVTDEKVTLNVIDTSGQNVTLLDDQSVPKYEMSEQEYEKRAESLRSFKKDNKLGRYSETSQDV
jgi:tubulin-folding cofactor B